jgi:hypothetical protein
MNHLKPCQFPNWDGNETCDNDRPIYMHYLIVWKVIRNNMAVMGLDMAQDIVLAPLPTINTLST